MLELRFLGRFEVRVDGTPITIPSRPAQSLLAYLALTAGTAHRRERVAGLLWPDAGDESARAGLRQGLWRLRKALEGRLPSTVQYFVADDLTVCFSTAAPAWLDVAVLAQPATDPDALEAAAAVYQGELLPGFYEDWVLRERERLEAVFERKMSTLVDGLVAEERWPAVLEWAERWIAVGHVPEPAYRALMLAHSARGDRARIATVYQRCRQALFEELGAPPSEQTRALFDRLSQHHRALQPAPAAMADRPDVSSMLIADGPAPGEPPYQGLHFFDEADAERFFGREAVVSRLAERLKTEAALAVIGASGSGKSSVVRAGLIPAWRRPGSTTDRSACAIVHLLTPTAHPLEALATTLAARPGCVETRATLLEALARDPRALRRQLQPVATHGRRSLVVVDQFEELFTLCHDAFEREAFVDNLLGLVEAGGGPVGIVIALRADFYAHCAHYPDLRRALAEHQEYLGPMGPEELRRAIEGPAERAGWDLEPGLVDLVLRDVGEEPGALPLLSHALLETWHNRRGRLLTLRGYAESGGVRGAIARTAETVFRDHLTADQQVLARRVFLRLTELGEGTQDTRRRARLEELAASPADTPALGAVLQVLARARLVTLGEGVAEVAHEALIREWPRLRAWLDEDRQGLRVHRQLTQSAQEWAHLERSPDLLYRGLRLAQAREWTGAHPGELNPLEREFVEASVALEEHEIAERAAQQQRQLAAERERADEQRRAAALLRRRAAYLVGALVVAVGMAGLALVFGDQARQSAAAAQTSAQVAFARELAAAASSDLDVDPERSILLALRAVSIAQQSHGPALREAETVLHRAVQTSRVHLTLRAGTAALFSATYSPDGRRLATIDQAGSAQLWDSTDGHEVLRLPTLTSGNFRGTGVVFSPDGARLATIVAGRTARVWDSATGAEVLTLPEQAGPVIGGGGPVKALAFSPDGRYLAMGSTEGTASVWDLASGQPVQLHRVGTGGVNALTFSPDGRYLAAGGDDATARVWDLQSGEEVWTLAGHREAVDAVAFSPDGHVLATGSDDATTKLWDLASGQAATTLFGHVSHVVRVGFDRAGSRLVTASEDGTARVWDARTGQLLLTLLGHTSGVLGASFSPDSAWVATASRDGTARVWDVSPTGGAERAILVGHSGPVFSVSFDPDGRRLATGSVDHTARVWDAANGHELLTLGGHTDTVSGTGFSPDGALLATTSYDGSTRIWDTAAGQQVMALGGGQPGSGLARLAWSADGRRVIATGGGRTVSIWDVRGGQELTRLPHPVTLQDLTLSPDGTRLATGAQDGIARVWDLTAGSSGSSTLDARSGYVNGVAFSPDGHLLATTGNDALVRLWDAQSGRQLVARSGHAGSTFGVAFSPDGRSLATSSVDRTVKLWHVVGETLDPEEPLTLTGHAGAVYRVAWSPDGRQLATASRDGTSRVYAIATDDLVALARARVTRGLTPEECARYLHAAVCPDDM